MNVTLISLVCIFSFVKAGQDETPNSDSENKSPCFVYTTLGPVSGIPMLSRNGSKYCAFLGMPFAKPPVGELRFQDPKEPEPWSEVRMADNYSSACSQLGWVKKTNSGNEDCLYINVFTPMNGNEPNKFPVLVWIYGGSFEIGEGKSYGPDYVMDKPIVFVTFNYRLGALGYLSANEKELQGNYGMKDQVAALRWVQKNVGAFGGNPGQVSIAGSSVGGASVNWHMHSELSKGLFHRAISQSGVAMSVWSEVPQHIARRRAIAFATMADCNFEPITELVKCLRTLPVEDILNIQQKLGVWEHDPQVFGIVVSQFDDSFAKRSAWNTNHFVNDVPWLLGFTSDEGAILSSSLLENNGANLELLNSKERLLPLLLYIEYFSNIKTLKDVTDITNRIKKMYFQEDAISLKNVKNVKNMIADSSIIYPITEMIHKHEGTKYLYMYDHVNEHSFAEFTKDIVKEDLRAVHSDDLISLFRTKYFPNDLNPADKEVSEKMVALWTNFVIYGDPNGSGELGVNWKPVSKNMEYLLIKKNPEMKTWDWEKRYSFWKSLELQRSDNDYKAT